MTTITVRPARLLVALIGLLALVACGSTRIVPTAAITEIEMVGSEFAFTAAQVRLDRATPYRFIVRNTGATAHEWVVTAAAGGDHAHDEHAAAVSAISSAEFGPGATVTREVTFAEPGSYEVACRLPGHYEAGMHLTVTVQ